MTAREISDKLDLSDLQLRFEIPWGTRGVLIKRRFRFNSLEREIRNETICRACEMVLFVFGRSHSTRSKLPEPLTPQYAKIVSMVRVALMVKVKLGD
jgi:hypothetical protein